MVSVRKIAISKKGVSKKSLDAALKWKHIHKKQPPKMFYKKVFLSISQISLENTCAKASYLIKLPEVCNFIKKETLVQVFYCKFCEIFKNTFFTEQLQVTDSDIQI